MSAAPTPVLHATLIARRFAEGWRGALLRGCSGCGKSTLALRALDAGFRLVADDRVLVWRSGGRLFGRAPASLEGLLEVRHVEVAARCRLAMAPVSLAVDLDGDPERLPDPAAMEIGGLMLPSLTLRPFEACAPSRLAQALEAQAPRRRVASLPPAPRASYQARPADGGTGAASPRAPAKGAA